MFLDQLARLGVINKVSTLAGPASDDENEDEAKPEKVSGLGGVIVRRHHLTSERHHDGCLLQEEEVQEDAREIQQGKPYHWRDWSIIRGRDCLYIWSDAAALELSNGSNGWFRFILDGKLATMYSSGSPEGGSDSSGTTSDVHHIFLFFTIVFNIAHTPPPRLALQSLAASSWRSCRERGVR